MTQISPSKLIPKELFDQWKCKEIDWSDPQKRIDFASKLSLEFAGKNAEAFYKEYETKQIKYHKRSQEEGFSHLILFPSTNIEQPTTLALPFDETALEPIFAQLKSRPQAGIYFDPQLADKNKILKGICTSITLDWIEQFLLQSKQKADLIERIASVAKRYLTGGEMELAYRQTVFNTIAYDPEHFPKDPLHAKVQAMANLHGLRLTPYTDEMAYPDQVSAAQAVLPDGIYLLRMINTFNAESSVKGENYGHSIALIKENGKTFLEDPNYGVLELPQGEEGNNAFASILRNFWFTSYRFYHASLAKEADTLSTPFQEKLEQARRAANEESSNSGIEGWLAWMRSRLAG